MENTEIGKMKISANIENENSISEKKHMPKNKLALIMSATVVLLIAASVKMDFTLQLLLLAFATAFYAVSVIIKPGILLAAAPVFSTIAVFLTTSDTTIEILLLSFIPAGLMLGFSVLHKRTRAQTVIRVGFVFTAAILAILFYLIYLENHSLSYEALDSTIYNLSSEIIESANGYGIIDTTQVLELGSPVDILAETLKIMSLGVILCIGLGLAYFATFIVKQAMKFFSYEEEYFAFDKKWELFLSKIAAVVHILTAMTYYTFANSDNLGYPAAVITLYYPLSSGFAVVGIKSLYNSLKANRYFLMSLFILALFGGLQTLRIIFVIAVIVGLFKTLLRGKKPILPTKLG